jgi:hypothetical protein
MIRKKYSIWYWVPELSRYEGHNRVYDEPIEFQQYRMKDLWMAL